MTDATRPAHPRLPPAVEVIDCTLRDGEQAPGVSFTPEEKLNLATALSEAGVSVLDAGFPAASDSDKEAIQAMRTLGLNASLGATARPLPGDIIAAAQARADEVFLFLPTSDLRLEQTLGITREGAIKLFRSGVETAADFDLGVNLVFEDATRTDVHQLIDTACELRRHVPLRRLVLADTVGCAHPASMEHLVRLLDDALDHDVALCTHSHNDFGLAVANTLAAVAAGARSITCTVNGIGERAGNADLAECVAALTHLYGVEHGVDPRALPALADAVERLSGIPTSPIKPVTGFNVYRHESGVHVDAILKNALSYTHLPPEWVGRRTEFVLGKHSGAALIRHVLDSAGIRYDEEVVRQALLEVKTWAELRDKSSRRQAQAALQAETHAALSGYDPKKLIDVHSSPRSSVKRERGQA